MYLCMSITILQASISHVSSHTQPQNPPTDVPLSLDTPDAALQTAPHSAVSSSAAPPSATREPPPPLATGNLAHRGMALTESYNSGYSVMTASTDDGDGVAAIDRKGQDHFARSALNQLKYNDRILSFKW